MYLHTLPFTRTLSNFGKFVCQQKYQHDISGICWGVELKISSFQIFTSLSCLNTKILYITRNVTWFHHITLHGWHCKEFPPEMKATERFRFSPSLHKSLLGNFNGFYQQTRIFIYELMQFMWLATWQQLCFLCGNFVKSRAHWKQRKNFDHGMSFLKEWECRSILAKPADKSCRKKEHSWTLKGIDGL